MNRIFFGAVFALVFSFSGCSFPKHVPHTVVHPAEIDMTNYKHIAVGDVTGNLGHKVAELLKARLVSVGSFRVLERQQLQRVAQELQLANSELAAANSLEIGHLKTAAALIGGDVSGSYQQSYGTKNYVCGKQTVTDKYDYKNHVRTTKEVDKYCKKTMLTGEYNASGVLNLIDAKTGEVLQSKSLSSSKKRTVDSAKSTVNVNALQQQAAGDLVAQFVRAFSPRTEHRRLSFAVDGDIPALEAGAKQAQMGNMKAAVVTFSQAIQDAVGNSSVDADELAKAYWNLGLGYQYLKDYDKAKQSIEKAYSLSSKSKYLREIEYIDRLIAEQPELKAQGLL